METFYVIVMNTRNNYKLYLCCGHGKSMTWGKKADSCWFNSKGQAEKFAKEYFKSFSKWSVEELNYDLEWAR